MSGSPDTLQILITIDRAEMSRRGKLGGITTHARHDSELITRPARSAFLARFASDAERRVYFAELGRRSGAARRNRAAKQGDAQ